MDRLHSPIEMRERGRRQLGYLPGQILTYPNCCAIMLRIPYVRQQVNIISVGLEPHLNQSLTGPDLPPATI